MAKKVGTYTTVHHPETGESKSLRPGDELPDWVDTDKLNPAIFADDEDQLDEADAIHGAIVAGPGQSIQSLSDDDKEQARKAAQEGRKRLEDQVRKAREQSQGVYTQGGAAPTGTMLPDQPPGVSPAPDKETADAQALAAARAAEAKAATEKEQKGASSGGRRGAGSGSGGSGGQAKKGGG